MRTILLILNICAFLASLIWLYKVRDLEPLISSILTLAGLIGFIMTKPKNKTDKTTLKQKAGKNSTQYQSGGDMTINN